VVTSGLEAVLEAAGSVGGAHDSHAAFRRALGDVLDHGRPTQAGASLSVGGGRATRELLHYPLQFDNPRDRVLGSPQQRFNAVAAVGRFVWTMAGSDRLADVEFYDANARRFSDDGVTVPGSCDGARLLHPRPGLNQLERVVELLRREAGSRRAVAAIYQPEDAGRRSRDIPCAIALAYNLREDGLHATTIMRSSNALKVLPYDLFLFSLLAEVVAAELEVEPAGYHQFAVSLHVYAEDVPQAEAVVAAGAPPGRAAMRPVPADPFGQLSRLVQLEQELRAGHLLAGRAWVKEHDQRIDRTLAPFWQDFARVLLLHAVRRGGLPAGERDAFAQEVSSALSDPFKGHVGGHG
jgi:thymidylate synthase